MASAPTNYTVSVCDYTALLAAANAVTTALQNFGGGGGGGTSSVSNLVNVQDYAYLTSSGTDWSPAFAAAIAAAVLAQKGGVFAPAKVYPCKKPGTQLPCIDLRGLVGFCLAGETGTVIRMTGSGSFGSWHCIQLGGDSADCTVRDLTVDGNYLNLTSVDPGQQTHLIAIGTTNSQVDGAARIKLLNLDLINSAGDGVALQGADGAYQTAGSNATNTSVSRVRLWMCRFDTNTRADISNQRCGEMVQAVHCSFNHPTGVTNTSGCIDFEPTSNSPATGPRRYQFIGCQFTRGAGITTTMITFSGCAGGVPSEQNLVMGCHFYGGAVGVQDGHNLIIADSFFELSDSGDANPNIKFASTCDGLIFHHNQVTRSAGAAAGKLIHMDSATIPYAFLSSAVSGVYIDTTLNHFISPVHTLQTGQLVRTTTTTTLPAGLSLSTNYYVYRVDGNTFGLATSYANAVAGTLIDLTDAGTGTQTVTALFYSKGVRFTDNTYQTYVASDSDNTLCYFKNVVGLQSHGNRYVNRSGSTITSGMELATSALWPGTTGVGDWQVQGEKFFGADDGNAAGSFTYGIELAPTGTQVDVIDTSHNTFKGCGTWINFDKGSAGSYAGFATAMGNEGSSGTPFGSLSNLTALIVGGNRGAVCFYQGTGVPSFNAPVKGCEFTRTDGTSGSLKYVATSTGGAWSAFA